MSQPDTILFNISSSTVAASQSFHFAATPASMPAPSASRNRTTETPLGVSATGHPYNGTGHYVENDEIDNSEYSGFTDLQTLFLASFATLVPLVFSLLTAFAVRILWRKYRRNRECRSYDGVLHQEESTDHLSTQSGAPLHAHLLNADKVKTCESQFSISADEIECSGSPVMYSGSSRTNHASANGSIITMTLKNNHLIVETEERNDIVEDSRETTMKYSPSAQDGVFVVEVQQGVRASRDSSGGTAQKNTAFTTEDGNDQKALVHNPPERFNDDETLDEVDEEYYPETTSPKTSPKTLKSSSTNTGLSQSTISISSNDPNPNYRYGNQQGYDNGYYGYPVYNGYINDDPIVTKQPNYKPKITSAVYKQNGRLMSMQSFDPETGLTSDTLAMRKPESVVAEDDVIQEEQRRLGNTPAADAPTPAIYCQIKETIIPAVSPKFEKLQNDLSPSVDATNNCNASTTNTNYENKAFVATELRKN